MLNSQKICIYVYAYQWIAVKAKTSVVSILPEDNYVGIEGKLFTFPSFWANAHRQTSDLKIFWSLNGKYVYKNL